MLIDKAFGDGERFAVVVRDRERMPSSTGGESEIGTLTFYVWDKIVGNGVNEMLYLGYQTIREFLKSQAQGAVLDPHTDCETLFEIIRSTYYFSDCGESSDCGAYNDDKWRALSLKANQYEPLILAAQGAPFFDGWDMFVVRNSKACRVIFTDTYGRNGHPNVFCACLEWEEIASVLREFCEWYKAYAADSRKAPIRERKKKRK